MFVNSPSFESPVEVHAYLLDHGVELHNQIVYQAPDGMWRGSGRKDDDE